MTDKDCPVDFDSKISFAIWAEQKEVNVKHPSTEPLAVGPPARVFLPQVPTDRANGPQTVAEIRGKQT